MPFGGGGFGGVGVVGNGQQTGPSAFNNGPGNVFAMQHPGSSFGAPGVPQGGGGFGGGGNQSAISGLLQQQNQNNQNSFNQAQANNLGRWNTGVDMLTGARDQYNNSALTAGTRGVVGGLLNDPLSLNATTQNNIMNRATGSIDAGANQQARNMAGAMAAGGQSDASSIAAAQNMVGRNAQAAGAQAQTNLGIQAALQRTQDLQNAAHLGQQQNAQDFGVNSQTANSYLQHMFLDKPYMQDNSGQIAAMSRNGMGGAGGMGGMGGGAYNGMAMGNFHNARPAAGGAGAINFAGGGGMTGGRMGNFGFGGGAANFGGNMGDPAQMPVNNGNPNNNVWGNMGTMAGGGGGSGWGA